jgi:hypothetical protein
MLAKNRQTSLADLYTISSTHHLNQSHVLSLSLQSSLVRGLIWQAEWLNLSEVAPPMSMLIEFATVSLIKAKKLVRPDQFRHTIIGNEP